MEINTIKNLKDENLRELDVLRKKSGFFSKLRMTIVIVGIILFICGISLKESAYYYLVFVTIIAFIIVGIIYRPIFTKIRVLELNNAVLDEYIYRSNGKWKQFSDSGSLYLKNEREHDLDLFGRNSLYQFISSAKTPSGKKYLADIIKNGVLDIKVSQKEVERLSNLDKSIALNTSLKKYQLKAKDFSIDDLIALESLTNEEVNIDKKWYIGIFLLPLITISGLVLAILNIEFSSIALFGLILNYFYSRIAFGKSQIFTYDTANMNIGIKGYKLLFKEIECPNIDVKSLNALDGICSMLASRRNMIAHLIGNMFFLDFFILFKMKNFKKANSKLLFEGIEAIAKEEAYLSLANINIIFDNTSYPNEGDEFKVKNIRHPLLDNNAVGNDFSLDGVVILTGSNMSGKTTFMRSLGINYVLFRAGGAVLADYFIAPKFELFTSLRVNDMTTEGISTFYAELKRISSIIEAIKDGKKVFALIDEIFKGTNALDRLAGAKAVVAKLINQYAIISTHDLELCKLDNIINYHFGENYIDDKINFDYKIKEGQSETTNGKFLMKSIGLMIE